MVGIGARIFNRPEDIDVAIQLTDGCVWSYNVSSSSIGPEIFTFVPCGSISDDQTGDKCAYTEEKWRTAVRNHWRPNAASDAVERPGVSNDQTTGIIKSRRLQPGILEVNDKRYILRPEAIESIFVMWRLTGDRSWQDKAWTMFTNIERHTRSDIASAALEDVTRSDPTQVDSMESFWLAETLKYFYLVFSDWDVVDLDKWILNTEAHPLRRPDA